MAEMSALHFINCSCFHIKFFFLSDCEKFLRWGPSHSISTWSAEGRNRSCEAKLTSNFLPVSKTHLPTWDWRWSLKAGLHMSLSFYKWRDWGLMRWVTRLRLCRTSLQPCLFSSSLFASLPSKNQDLDAKPSGDTHLRKNQVDNCSHKPEARFLLFFTVCKAQDWIRESTHLWRNKPTKRAKLKTASQKIIS